MNIKRLLAVIVALLTAAGVQVASAQAPAGFHDGKPDFKTITLHRLDGSVYRSADAGVTWTPLIKSPSLSYFDIRQSHTIHLITKDGHRYDSYDGGTSYWRRDLNNGGANPISAGSAPIRTATSSQPKVDPDLVKLIEVVPNPTTGRTSIHFDLTQAARVRLSITAPDGSDAILLVDKDLTVGPHSFTFSVAKLPVGIYNYRLVTTGHILTGNIVVVH